MKKIILLIVFLISTQIQGFGQNPNYLEKYKYYRERFSRYFVYVGPNAGESLPFINRDTSSASLSNSIGTDDLPDLMGYYLGMIATEFKLTQDAGGDTGPLLRELFYSVNALNRLDVYDYRSIGNSDLDGFMAREDFPEDFVSTHPSLNEGLPFSGSNIVRVNTHNGFVFSSQSDDPNRVSMSMDHYCRVLMGLSLIKKCVGSGTTYNNTAFQDGETGIQEEAMNIADRIVGYMQHGHWFLWMPEHGLPPSNGNPLNIFDNTQCNVPTLQLFDPLSEPCTNCPYFSFGHTLAPRGCLPLEYCYGLAKAGHYISGSHYYGLTTAPEIIFNKPFWEAGALINDICNGDDCLYSQTGNLVQILVLAAIGDSWNIGGVSTKNNIDRIDNANQTWKTFTLLHCLLHDEAPPFGKEAVEDILNSAPCNGPHGTDTYWYTGNRFEQKSEAYSYNPQQFASSHFCTFSGLDYMMLFNLYYLNYQSELPAYQAPGLISQCNGSSSVSFDYDFNLGSSIDFPFSVPSILSCGGATSIGSSSHPLTISAINQIEASNSVSSNANLTYKAGNKIEFLPGFHTETGAHFEAYIKEACSNGSGYERMASSFNLGDNSSDHNLYSANPTREEKKNSEQSNSALDCKIFPNPNSGQFTMLIPVGKLNSQVNQIKIYNVLGETIYESKPENIIIEDKNLKLEIDLKTQSGGIYFIRIQSVEKSFIQKLVID